VTLNNIHIQYAGGGKKSDSEQSIPELISQYPKAKMFGTLPAYGLFVRHVRNIKLSALSFSYKDDEARSAIKFNDVSYGQISDFKAASSDKSAPFIWLDNCNEIEILDSSPRDLTDTFLKAENSSKIFLIRNHLSKAKQKYDLVNTKAEDIIENINY